MLVCTFGYSWSLTILGQDQEEQGDRRCMKSWELHQLHILMTFGDRTPSRGDPNTAHFYTKVQVWGRMV
jgi:hypothetical protein